MAFNLSEVLKDVSLPDTNRERFAYLPYASLLPDPTNGYSMDGVEELARNIELVGLQQPLRVKELGADAYGLISGHRRHAAIGRILQRDPGAFADGIPCVIDAAGGSVAMRELQLLLANADNRKMTAADEAQQAERISDCLRRLEDEGYKFPGRHRDWVSKLSGLSRTKIGRLEAIRHNLAASLLQHFNDGDLGVTTAYRLSQEKEQIQHEVYRIYGKGINDLNEAQLEEAIARRKAPPPEPKQQANPDPYRSSFDAESYLAERAKEDEQFFLWLTETARPFLAELEGMDTRQAGIERLKRRFGMQHSGHGGPNMVEFDAAPKGLTLCHANDRRAKIFRTWTEVYDMLCLIALNRVANGEGLDDEDEDDEPEEKLPTVRWESRAVTPPQREQLLLYQLTNAGPKYTPAVYCGGAVFRKPAWAGQTGAELTGIAQQFSSWLKIPDPNSYGEEYIVEPPKELTPEELRKTLAQSPIVSSPDTPAAWHTGEPPKAGLYYCRLKWTKPTVLKWNPERKVFSYPASGGELTGELPDWYPLPEVD